MARFSILPTELKLLVLTFLPEREDLSSLSCCDRSTHLLVSDVLFSASFARRIKSQSPGSVFKALFVHAVNHDSRNIVRWLVCHELHPRLQTSFLQATPQAPSISYLHFAVLNDAPQVAIELARHGAYIHDLSDHPDLEPLYLGLSMPQMGPNALQNQLHIACAYALPRTARRLLARGADPNYLSRFGLAPIHSAVRSRPPWHHFSRAKLMPETEIWQTPVRRETEIWQTLVLQTASNILHFGGDSNLRSEISRLHSCGSQCWRSPDCGHQGQTSLHFAGAGGIEEVVDLLLQHRADPGCYDDEGHLPLYYAMSQGHVDASLRLLRERAVPGSIIVVRPSQSTALHIAARFGLTAIVSTLLMKSPAAGMVDADGKTPRDEAMAQTHVELEDCISEVLDMLSAYDIPPESAPQALRTKQRSLQMGSTLGPERNPKGLALDYDIIDSGTEVLDVFRCVPKRTSISIVDPPRCGPIQQSPVIRPERFPPLETDSSFSSMPMLNPVHSRWLDEEGRKALFARSPSSEGIEGALFGPSLSARSEPDLEDTWHLRSATDLQGRPHVGSSSHSAKFWSALTNRTHCRNETSAPLLPERNDQQFAANKKRNRKWAPLRW